MKKVFLSLAVMLAAGLQAAVAAPVSRGAASEFARNFFGSSDAELAFTNVNTVSVMSSSASKPAFFAFNNPSGGWAIIAADDCATPVLAHSDVGSISLDAIPSNMRIYLRTVTDNIDKMSRAGKVATDEIRAVWAANGVASGMKVSATDKVELQTAAWGQDSPYNQTVCQNVTKDGTPVSDLYTGCVATAMAIVLQYMGYPKAPVGVIPGFKTNTKKYSVPSVDLDSYGDYDWADMPKTKPRTDAQKKAVADLIFHCGAMVRMDYTKDGSGADSADIPGALIKYMSFSPVVAEYYRESYSDYEWFDMLKAEIDAKRPILYGGIDAKSVDGHQFVVDGYNSSREVHVNWGWDGAGNGWFAVCYLGNYSSVDDVFNYYDSAILGLVPDPSAGKACPAIYLESDDNDPGIRVTGDIRKGGSFSITAYPLNMDSERGYDGSMAAALVGSDGTIKEFISPEYTISIEASDGRYLSYTQLNCQCRITSDIRIGDFISIFYKDGLGNWARLGGTNHVVTNKDYDSGAYYTISRVSAVPSVAYVYVPKDIREGDVIYLDLVTGVRCPASVSWRCDGNAVTDHYIKPAAGTHVVTAVVKYIDGTSETISRKITVR